MHIAEDMFNRLWKMKPFISTDTVVIKDDEVLLVRRAIEPFRDQWVLPGGLMDIGEKIEQTAVREVREETGFDVKLLKLIGVYSGPHRDPRGTTAAVCFLAEIIGKAGDHDHEISEVKFFPLDELPNRMGFDHRDMIRDALKVYGKR